MKAFIALFILLSARVDAKRYIYTTQTMTDCFKATQSDFGPPEPTKGPDGTWTITMPKCHNCHCPDCTYTHSYTATFDVFNPNGTSKWTYSIEEVYPGMSTMPSSAVPTSVPYGFTKGVRTCRICGEGTVVATMTYPRGAPPYRQSIPAVQAAAETLANEAGRPVETAAGTSVSPVSTLAAGAEKAGAGARSSSSRSLARPSRSMYAVGGMEIDDGDATATQQPEPTDSSSESSAGRVRAPWLGGAGLALLLPLVLVL